MTKFYFTECQSFARYSPKYIMDIYFFEVNTKYISSSVFKTNEYSDVFNSPWYLPKKGKFSFYFIFL